MADQLANPDASGRCSPLRAIPDAVGAVLDLPAALLGRSRRVRRDVERALASRTPTRAMVAVPRTARFVGTTALRHVREPVPGLPVPNVSPALAAQVAIDELILAIAMGPNRFPRRSDYERVGAELAYARLLFEERGWIADPVSYHRDPPPLDDPSMAKGWALGQGYEQILFPSEFAPRDEEPGAERWSEYEANHTAVATVLRHRGAPRPWVVAVHGFACGYPFMDFVGLHALRLHRDLGLNVVLPVLPLHGPRKINRVSGEAFLTFDLINTLHGLTQAVWDIRRILSWVRAQDPQGIGLYGVSLGAYTVSLLAGLDDGIDAVIAGIPVVDFPAMFRSHSPRHIRLRAMEHEILGGNAETVHRVVSPLAVTPSMPRERRFIYAGLGDRLVPASQAHSLWRHWDEPTMHWYGGNHVGYLWSGSVGDFVVSSLTESGLTSGPTPPDRQLPEVPLPT